jgi:hypothetical protein
MQVRNGSSHIKIDNNRLSLETTSEKFLKVRSYACWMTINLFIYLSILNQQVSDMKMILLVPKEKTFINGKGLGFHY